MRPVVIVPVRSFAGAKRRLARTLGEDSRSRLAVSLVTRTIGVVREVEASATVVSSSREVAAWAHDLGIDRVDEPVGRGLSGAATAGVRAAGRRPWLVLHADLPLLTSRELDELVSLVEAGNTVLAPSYDGGTTAIGGSGPFSFDYGPDSFRRHLRASGLGSRIVSRIGLQLDLDTPDDLANAAAHSRGGWLAPFATESGSKLV